MGSLVTPNLFPNFSICLDKILITLTVFLKSSSSFSTLSVNPPFILSLVIIFHCRLRSNAPAATPLTNIIIPHRALTLLPLTVINQFFHPFTVRATEKTADENRQDSSIAERRESKLRSLIATRFWRWHSGWRSWR